MIMIDVKNVTKTYKLYKNEKLKALSIFMKKIPSTSKIVLKNISFTINKNESVAIIGKNGSGKSTLLKLINEISYPDSGEIIVNGKISSLLEINAGFDMDFTGRENIYIKYNMLGYNDNEIKKMEKKIIEFSEIGEYIDQPVKTYSTGMKARLGFTININTYPEILLVDEIFSVGDLKFREKCYKYINKLKKENNITLVLVTHSTQIAKLFCERGIVLHESKIICDDKIDIAVEKYKKIIGVEENEKN